MGPDDITAIHPPAWGRRRWPSHQFGCLATFDLHVHVGTPSRCPARSPFSACRPTHLFGGIPSDVGTRLWPQPLWFMSPRVGARPNLSVGQAFITCPASRLPARGRDQASAPAAPRRAGFGPLALCEGTTRYAPELRNRPCISIHPPAQGTIPEQTRQNGEKQAFPPCSHAREGPGVLQRPPILAAFQSTSPRRVRRCRELLGLAAAVIQPPAPARGATVTHQTALSSSIYFSPYTRGATIPAIRPSRYAAHFNPHTHMGCNLPYNHQIGGG